MDLETLYDRRFGAMVPGRREEVWREIARYLHKQGHVLPEDNVLDLACGSGEFINNLRARRRVGVDLNKDATRRLEPNVEFYHCDARRLSEVVDPSFDLCVSSNFLEHLETKADLLKVLSEVNAVLKPEGRILLIGPNIKHVGGAYWDFLDHHLALTETSVCEALTISGFEPQTAIGRFLPYTMKSRLPTHPLLVRTYLNFRPAWQALGKQFLIVATKVRQV